MNRWILASSLLSFAVVSVHVFAGGPDVHDPLLAAGASATLNTYVSVLWHATTAVLLVDAVALFVAAVHRGSRAALVGIVTSQYLAYAALFVGYGLHRLGSLLVTPQWIAFVVISVVALIGAWPRPTAAASSSLAGPAS
ncbi:MAG: hypothetical protein GX458_23420 [Phyllobacteriaceae bacterium]|nr:hypothetical protein [Phyllobacteriaceae bacterium]